jgi:hypothetical protein
MKKKQGIGRVLAAASVAVASMLVGAPTQATTAPAPDAPTNTREKKEAIPASNEVVKPQSNKNKRGGFSGDANNYKHIRKDGRNQRQWRKWLRSNPNMRKSKHGQK